MPTQTNSASLVCKLGPALVEEGRLSEALPLLKELITRVESNDQASIPLDFPIFLTGTAFIQVYLETGDSANLREALVWYDKLVEEYSDSLRLRKPNQEGRRAPGLLDRLTTRFS